MLAYGALLKANQNSDQVISQLDSLMEGAANGDAQINSQARERLEQMGIVSREEFETGFEVQLSNGETTFKNFNVTDTTWRIYSENRAAVAQSAIDVLQANMDAVVGQRQQALENFSNLPVKTIIFPDILEFIEGSNVSWTTIKLSKLFTILMFNGSLKKLTNDVAAALPIPSIESRSSHSSPV